MKRGGTGSVLLKRCGLYWLCLAGLLCAGTSLAQAQENHTNKCLEYFTEIAEIEQLREMLRIVVGEVERRYDAGILTKEQLDTTLAVWYSTENELAQKVAKIQTVAQAQRCLEKPSRKEEK